ncbi:hypothetical protein [Heliorestis convoluta]|uniref:DUF1614 domain-containing protein n=1 Tax=Heliorestis convoluta TaxID=356322 RepID=A0A5Q2N691_9FIRM|nr:hypothetical protein [Heliorestis convoluta]QGG47780.1 hypothetical protein FTV88_1681 [Heliorestis convoluta]
MPRYPFGTILLALSFVFLFFDMAKSFLERFQLTKAVALVIILLWWGASYLELPLQWVRWNVTINVGAFLVPLFLGLFFLIRSERTSLRLWVAIGAVIISGIMGQQLVGMEQEHFFWDGRILFVFLGALAALLITTDAKNALIALLLGHPIIEASTSLLAGPRSYFDSTGYLLGSAVAFDHVILAALFLWPLTVLMERFVTYEESEANAWLPLYLSSDSEKEKQLMNEMDGQANEETLVEQEEYKSK